MPAYDGLNTPVVDAAGFCEVLCYTDNHEANFGSLSLEQIRIVMEAWRDRTREISKLPNIAHIFPFENRGVEIGVTLHHPHGQIYSYSYSPPVTRTRIRFLHRAVVPLIALVSYP